MARLPVPGGDQGDWGDILNQYLLVTHDDNGHLRSGTVGSSQITNGTVTQNHIADNALPKSKVQNLETDLAAKYIKPAGGIPRGDLAADVQNSLALADTALQSVPPTPPQTGGASLSGFPLRMSGEKQHNYPIELGKAYASSASPAGAKRVILAESWGEPGVLRHIWTASSDGDASETGFAENGGQIRIFIDDAQTPVVSLSVNDFFAYAVRGSEFSTPRVGRTKSDGGESSAYRYLHMPFQKYLRVEVENKTSSPVTFFGAASYSLISDYASIGTEQRNYKMHSAENSTLAAYSPLTVVDTNGSGQVESIWVAVDSAGGNVGVLEGNIEIYADNSPFPSWSSSGIEDAFNGGWYSVPVGGYPAGKMEDALSGGIATTYYRFFIDDPIFFDTHIKIVAHAGQRGQGTIGAGTVNLSAFAGVWTNDAPVIDFAAVDTEASPLLDDQFSGAPGALSAADWNQPGDKVQATATGSLITFAYDGGTAGQDTRAARKNVSLPANYWVETRVRITDASHDGQDASLIALGSSPDPYFGSAVHVQLTRFTQYNWVVRVRDDFDEVFIRTIGGGRDLTNQWVKLALKVVGTTTTAYWQPDGSSVWQPMGSWTTSKTGQAVGIGTWSAGAEFDYLVVRPVADVNG